MPLARASDLLVECLEAEGVRHVPGEKTLDLDESLSPSVHALGIDCSIDVGVTQGLGQDTVIRT